MSIHVETWRYGCEKETLWVDFTTILAEYFTMHKNPLSRFDMAHLFNFYNSMSASPACVLVAYVDGKPAGMVMIETMRPRETRPYGHEISRLYVRDQYRGQGLGKLLMIAAMKQLEQAGREKAFLLVDKSNTAAVQMYDNMGFTTNAVAAKAGTEGILYLEVDVATVLHPVEVTPTSIGTRMLGRLQRLFAILRTEVVH